MTGRSVFRVHRELIDRQRDPNPDYATLPEPRTDAEIRTHIAGYYRTSTITVGACAIGAYSNVQRAIRDDRWRLILYWPAGQNAAIGSPACERRCELNSERWETERVWSGRNDRDGSLTGPQTRQAEHAKAFRLAERKACKHMYIQAT